MKTIKRTFSLLIVFILMLSLIPAAVSAANKDTIPKTVRLFSSYYDEAILIELNDVTQYIENIRTNNKNLFASITKWDLAHDQNAYTIGLISKKNGTYTVSFDIMNKNNKKVSTKKITVYAYDHPIKSITFDGKDLPDGILTGNSAKVKVSLSAGNKIKKLQYSIYEKLEEENNGYSSQVYKTFKNGDKITFGTIPYYYHYNEHTDDTLITKRFYSSLYCPTFIYVTYTDKYTKQDETFHLIYHKFIY